MKKLFIIFFLVLLSTKPGIAVIRHSTETIIDYKKYYVLTKKNPDNKYYHFEFAIVLAAMGKIEAANSEFAKISSLDDKYPFKLCSYLENVTRQNPSWKNNFKLGFCYYFLFDEFNGRIELAERRINRAKEKDDKERIKEQKNIIKETAPQANYYYQKALLCLQKVSNKKPINSINAMAYAYQAFMKSKIKSWTEAKELCEKGLDIAPNAYAIRAAYADTLRQTGNIFAATGQLSQAYKLKSAQENYEKELLGDAYLE